MFHVVDDTESICKIVTAMLKHHGHEAISFGCPKDYISFVRSPGFRTPVAVFTDVTMPAMTGYEMMDIVSELRPELRFVVLTAAPEIRAEHANKACMYLAKPFTLASLLKVVGSLIQCHAFSPAYDHRCTSVDNRQIFPIENWSCPHRCEDCSSG